MEQAGGGSTRELTLKNWPPTTASTSQAVNIQPTSRLVRRIDGVRAGPGEQGENRPKRGKRHHGIASAHAIMLVS
jgi:hypothetical protein